MGAQCTRHRLGGGEFCGMHREAHKRTHGDVRGEIPVEKLEAFRVAAVTKAKRERDEKPRPSQGGGKGGEGAPRKPMGERKVAQEDGGRRVGGDLQGCAEAVSKRVVRAGFAVQALTEAGGGPPERAEERQGEDEEGNR